jgi:O-antigen/teichoic acid export membrane protein
MILLGLFGMSKVIIKEVAIAHNKKDLDHIANVMHSAYWLNGLITISLSILLILASPWVASSIYEEPKLTYPLIIAFVVMTPQVFSRIFSSGLIGFRKIWQSNLVDQALSICLTSVLVFVTWLFVQELSVNMVATCYAIGRVGVTLSVGLFWKKIYKNNVSSKKIFQKLLKTAKPLLLISIAGIVINSSDIIILGFFSEAKDVGTYVVAARIALLTSVLLHISNSALSPKIAALYSENNIKSLEEMIKRITKGLFFIGLFVFLFFIFSGNWILSIWGEEFEEAYWILIILGFGQLVNLTTGAAGIILIMTGHEKTQRNISLCFMMVFLILSFTIIPIYGALGASIASATTVVGINITKLIYVKKNTKINIY